MRLGLKAAARGSAAILEVAEKGNERECFMVGWMSEYGYFLPKDLDRAATVYKKAADGGNILAQTALGLLYLDGAVTHRLPDGSKPTSTSGRGEGR